MNGCQNNTQTLIQHMIQRAFKMRAVIILFQRCSMYVVQCLPLKSISHLSFPFWVFLIAKQIRKSLQPT